MAAKTQNTPAAIDSRGAGGVLSLREASAVVGARTKIVEGAVGMVRLEQATQQVVNTGSLYS